MGRQVSVIKFVGRIGNVLSYYLNNKLTSRTVGKVDLEKMRTAPQYEETRKNQSEFAVASKAGQLFRQGLMHLTKGYTNYAYPTAVVQILLKTLRGDMTQPKGQKQIKNGLKDASAQLAFRRLNIFCKRETELYSNVLVKRTPDQKAWRLNRNLLFGKGVKGDQMTVKIGYYHVDFEGRVAHYEDAVSIACHRNEKIDFSDFTLPKPNETGAPWTFVIIQVWREGSIQEVTGMTFMSVVDVVEHDISSKKEKDVETQNLHKCGREKAEESGQGLHLKENLASKNSKRNELHKKDVDQTHISHEYSLNYYGRANCRPSLVTPLKLHGLDVPDLDKVIGNVVNKR